MVGKIVGVIFVILVVLGVGGLLFLYFYPGVGKTPNAAMQEAYAQKTPYFQEGKFQNPYEFSLLTGETKKQSDEPTKPSGTIPVVYSEEVLQGETGRSFITWLGHSSFLLQMGTKNILIDPVLSTYASPVRFVGSKRFSDLAITPDNLPQIDVLLLSHDHYDHMDYPTIMTIDEKVQAYIVPLGVESYLLGWGIDPGKIHPLAWWEEQTIDSLQITLTPAQHYSGRNPLKTYTTWWGGYYLEDDNHSLYYTGDTGCGKHFQEVYERKGAAELIIPDTGQYNEGWAMCHMNPQQAVQAARDVQAQWIMPAHWGAFVLAHHPWNEPPRVVMEETQTGALQAVIPKIGERVDFDQLSSYQEPWWENVD